MSFDDFTAGRMISDWPPDGSQKRGAILRLYNPAIEPESMDRNWPEVEGQGHFFFFENDRRLDGRQHGFSLPLDCKPSANSSPVSPPRYTRKPKLKNPLKTAMALRPSTSPCRLDVMVEVYTSTGYERASITCPISRSSWTIPSSAVTVGMATIFPLF